MSKCNRENDFTGLSVKTIYKGLVSVKNMIDFFFPIHVLFKYTYMLTFVVLISNIRKLLSCLQKSKCQRIQGEVSPCRIFV